MGIVGQSLFLHLDVIQKTTNQSFIVSRRYLWLSPSLAMKKICPCLALAVSSRSFFGIAGRYQIAVNHSPAASFEELRRWLDAQKYFNDYGIVRLFQ